MIYVLYIYLGINIIGTLYDFLIRGRVRIKNDLKGYSFGLKLLSLSVAIIASLIFWSIATIGRIIRDGKFQ